MCKQTTNEAVLQGTLPLYRHSHLSKCRMCVQVMTPGIRVNVPSTPEQLEVQPSATKASGTATERPEELVPDIIAFLKHSPHIRGVAKAVQV